METSKILIGIILFLCIIPAVQAEQVIQFNDSSSSVLLTTTDKSKLIYFTVPTDSNIINATFNITKTDLSNYTVPVSNSFVCNDSSTGKISNCGNADDGDVTTVTIFDGTTFQGSILENHTTISTNVTNLIVTSRLNILTNDYINMTCFTSYNETSTREIFFSEITTVDVRTRRHYLPEACYNTTDLRINVTYDQTSPGSSSFYELLVHWEGEPTNLTVDISDDGNNEYFEESFDFNVTVNLNTSEIESYMQTCVEHVPGFCNVPINVSMFGIGNITVHNLDVNYNATSPISFCEGNINTSVLNMTVFDEENTTENVLTNFNIFLNITESGSEFENTIVSVNNVTTLELCMTPSDGEYTVDGIIEYTNSQGTPINYSTRYYHFQNIVIDNVTDHITLFLLEDALSNSIQFNIQNEFAQPLGDHILRAQRFFINNGNYIQVDMGLTDFEGQSPLQLKINEWYIFVVEEDNSIIRRFDQKFITTADDVTLNTFTGSTVEYFEYYDTVGANCTVDVDSEQVACFFSDTSGKMVNMSLTIEEKPLIGNFIKVCEQSTTAASGTVTCSFAGKNDTEMFYSLEGTFCCSEITFFTIIRDTIDVRTTTTYGITGIIILILILIIGHTAGLFHPSIPIITSIIVLIGGFMMGLISISWFAIVSLVLAGGILVYRMK